jgi:hypothetical protein
MQGAGDTSVSAQTLANDAHGGELQVGAGLKGAVTVGKACHLQRYALVGGDETGVVHGARREIECF